MNLSKNTTKPKQSPASTGRGAKTKANKKRKATQVNKGSRSAPVEQARSSDLGGVLDIDATGDLPLSDNDWDIEADNTQSLNKHTSTSEDTEDCPFTDGIVSRRLKGLAIIEHEVGSNDLLTRTILQYLSTTNSYIGNITAQTSFMKSQGGQLL